MARQQGANGFVLFSLTGLRDEVGRILGETVFATSPAGPGAAADFNSDGQTDFRDFILFAQHYESVSGEPSYQPRFDLDGNGRIAFADFLLFVRDYL